MARLESISTVNASLKHAGFVVFPDLLSAEESRRLATAYDNAISRGSAPDLRASRNGSQVRLANLLKYDSVFKELLALEPVLEACELVIGPRTARLDSCPVRTGGRRTGEAAQPTTARATPRRLRRAARRVP